MLFAFGIFIVCIWIIRSSRSRIKPIITLSVEMMQDIDPSDESIEQSEKAKENLSKLRKK